MPPATWFARRPRGGRLTRPEVTPGGILRFDQRDLLRSPPPLELFLSRDCVPRRRVLLDVDESIELVLRAEPTDETRPVCVHPLVELRRHADVERAGAVREDVDGEGAHAQRSRAAARSASPLRCAPWPFLAWCPHSGVLRPRAQRRGSG